MDLIHPPSILPILSMRICRATYFLLSMVLISFIKRMRNLIIFKFTDAFSRMADFLSGLAYPASRKHWMVLIIKWSVCSKIVCRSFLGTNFLYS